MSIEYTPEDLAFLVKEKQRQKDNYIRQQLQGYQRKYKGKAHRVLVAEGQKIIANNLKQQS